MKSCKKCLMPDTFPGVSINDEEICNHCLNFHLVEFLGGDKLKQILSSRKGEKYDCILPISGGLDSTYALYLAKTQLHLRPLAVFYENQFSSELARENIKKACSKLEVDLHIFETRGKVEKNLMSHFLRAMVPLGITWGICVFCHYGIAAAIYRIAMKEKIPNILWAITPYENLLLFPRFKWNEMEYKQVLFNMKDHFNLEFPAFIWRPLKKNLTFGKFFTCGFHLLVTLYYSLWHRLELFTPPFSNLFRIKPVLNSKTIKEFMIYQYFEWDGKKIEETLKAELDFKKPDDRESLWKYDCVVFPINDIRWRNAYGASLTKLCCGALIRAGVLTTEEGIKKVAECENDEVFRARIRAFLAEFNLPEHYMEYLLDN